MSYTNTKECGTNIGFKCVYRDYLTTGPNRFLSGHSLGFVIEMSSEDKAKLINYIDNSCAWMDQYLEEAFGNTLIVSSHDPFVNVICIMETEGLADIRLMEKTTISDFARMILTDFSEVMKDQTSGEVWIKQVRVKEHGAMLDGLA